MKNKKVLPPPAPPPEASARRKRLAWAAGLFLGFAALYFFSHDRLYYFDGLLQSGMINSPLSVNPPQVQFEWNHFLWYPTGRAFFLALEAVGLGRDGYEALQLFNTLLGAAGVALLFWILSRWASPPWAAAWTVMAGLGQVYWYRSAGAENHLAAALWCILQIHFLLAYWESPGAINLFGLAATGLLAAYYHLGHFAAWGVAGLAVLIRRPRGRTFMHAAWVTLLIGAGWIPYADVHGWFDPGGFKKWWLWSTAQAHGFSATAAGTKGIDWNLFGKGVLSLETLVKSFLYFDAWTWGTTLRLAALLGLGSFTVWYGRRAAGVSILPERRGPAMDRKMFLFLLPFGAFFLLYSVWMPGNYMYWIVPWASLCLFFGAFTYRFQPPKVPALSWTALGLMIVLLFWSNLTAVILPHKEFVTRNEVEMCRELGRLMPPESPVVISGRLQNNLKPYIPYFARRNRLAVELFALNGQAQGMDPIEWMRDTIAHYLGAGIPVYITEDALRCKDSFPDFNLAPERVEGVWRPFTLIHVKDFPEPPANKLYLMWSPGIPAEQQYVFCLRLKMSGLKDQLRAVYAERMARDKSPRLAEEARRSLDDDESRP